MAALQCGAFALAFGLCVSSGIANVPSMRWANTPVPGVGRELSGFECRFVWPGREVQESQELLGEIESIGGALMPAAVNSR